MILYSETVQYGLLLVNECTIMVQLNGIWIVCDVAMYQHIHVIFGAYYYTLV